MSLPPDALPDFTILGTAGEGAFGTVLVVRDQTGVPMALKVLHRGDHTEREHAALVSIRSRPGKHPGLIDIHHVGTAATGHLYYTMPLADPATSSRPGEPGYAPRTLARHLRDHGPMPPAELRPLAASLLDTAAWLHANGIAHRDIKPGNILFVSGAPKLADLGLACSSEVDNRPAGTPTYLPPDGSTGADADLYALGKVLYECATGADPDDYPSLPRAYLSGPWKNAGPAFNKFLHRACAPAAADRFASAADFRQALEAALEPPRWSRRKWIPLAVGAGALAVAAPFAWRRPRPPVPPPDPPFTLPDGLSPADQVKAVYAELRRRNLRFPMVGRWREEEGRVVRLDIPAGDITDLSPVGALVHLRHVGCGCGNGNLRGNLQSLNGLRGLQLTSLECVQQQVSNLDPLAGMPLGRLEAGWNDIADLGALASLPLAELMVNSNPVASLKPIADLPLAKLGVGHTPVTDWTPLERMPLRILAVSGTGFSDFRVLKNARLEWLNAEGCPVADWSPLDAMPLAELMVSGTGVPSRAWVLAHPTLRAVNGRPREEYLK